MIPGEVMLGDSPVTLMEGRLDNQAGSVRTPGTARYKWAPIFILQRQTLPFSSTGPRPWGKGWPSRRGPASASSPASSSDVELVDFAGARLCAGFRGEVRGAVA